MVVDSSAICCVFLAEAGHEKVLSVLETTSEPLYMSAVNVFETAIVLLSKLGPETVDDMFLFLQRLGIQIVAFGTPQAVAAYAAYRVHGRGFGAARLNLGDCAAYVTARENPVQKLLFVGDDFGRTDIEPVL